MFRLLQRGLVALFVVWFGLGTPLSVFAQDVASTSSGQAVDALGDPTGAPSETGAPGCTGAGCDQGTEQGTDQGTEQGSDQGGDQGGPSIEDLGGYQDESGAWVLPEGTDDTRQGAAQGSTNGVTATNSDTGADSSNTTTVDARGSTSTSVTNTAQDTTAADLAGTTGGNTHNSNTGSGGITSGDAGIGVTQVKNDNTTTIGGSAGLQVDGYRGDQTGDLHLGFGAGTANLSSADGGSIRAINDTTGSGSENDIDIATRTEELTEVQNDGRIDNILNLAALTGGNDASKNTGDASITTGDANVAATLVNLLNSTVINGSLWVTVADVFGNLDGDIYLPDLATYIPSVVPGLAVTASNEETGSDSENDIDIAVADTETTVVENDADITTTVDAQAITGQNEADKNTSGGSIATGDASVSASNLSLANTTVEGGDWGLVVVNALNRWLGFLVGDNGEVRALSQNETVREIEARNAATGSDSTNDIDIAVESDRTTIVDNTAVINNDVTASAITGQNTANKNTGAAQIETGDANVEVTAVNIANTTVKDGSLFIAVVNIFGDWLGDLFYDDQSLLASAGVGSGSSAEISGSNEQTGSDSTNSIDVSVDRERETTIDNKADFATTLNAEIDTGGNRTNRNTLGGAITTGDGQLALHSRAVANFVGLAIGQGGSLDISGLNDTTGTDSENRIRARVNDERIVTVTNDANVSTVLPGLVNTGNNEASYNTLGGSIVTGDAAADVGISTLINRVLLALADPYSSSQYSGQAVGAGLGSGFVVSDVVLADFLNHLTGAFSDNENSAEYTRDYVIEILNDGVVDNLVDLLLNTGGNKANNNTGGGALLSGAGCVDVGFESLVNQGSGYVAGVSLTLDNTASVVNDGSADVTTGFNEASNNTGGDGAYSDLSSDGPCPRLALHEDTPGVLAVGGGVAEEVDDADSGSGDSGDGGGEGDGSVLGSIDEAVSSEVPVVSRSPRTVLTRFPVAGGDSDAFILPASRRNSPWMWLLVGGAVVTGAAWHFDRRAYRMNRLARFE